MAVTVIRARLRDHASVKFWMKVEAAQPVQMTLIFLVAAKNEVLRQVAASCGELREFAGFLTIGTAMKHRSLTSRYSLSKAMINGCIAPHNANE